MRFTIPCICCACRSPLLVASCLLPSFGFGCRCSLLPSPSLFTCAVFRGSLYWRSSSLGVVRASGLAFSLYVSFCFASASLLSGYPGFLDDYPLLSPSLPAIHLCHFSCSPHGYLSLFSYPSPHFRVFYCVRLIPCDFALALPLFPFLGSSGMSYSFLFLL